MLAADIDRDLVEPEVEPIVAAELATDRFLERDRAVDERIFGLAAADRLDRRFLDEIGRVEIGLARRQADHVDAVRFQLGDARGHCERGRGLDAIEGGGGVRLQRHDDTFRGLRGQAAK